jgi:hypothetical protein
VEKRGLLAALKSVAVVQGDWLLYVDEMRVGLWGQVRRVWGIRGIPVVQKIQIVFDWRYLVLGVNPQTGKLIGDWVERIRQDQLLPILQRWPPAAIVWDNASAHKGKQIATLQHRFIFLPPYSPELDPAERIFRHLRPRIEGRTYPSMKAKQIAVEHHLRQLAADRARVKSLVNWDWIQIAHDSLPAS